MDILFISQLYPEAILPTLMKQSKIGMDWAAHNLSTAIIKGMKENGINLSVLNVPMMGSFPPFAKSPFVPGYKEDGLESIPYLNITYLKRKDTVRRVMKSAEEWYQTTKGERCILFYNYQYLDIVVRLKQRHHDLKTVLLLTDLPEYTQPHKTIFTRLNELVSPVEDEKKGNRYNYVDGYIFLADGMKDRMPVNGKPWLLMEGIYNDEINNNQVSKDEHKVIMYTGNLGGRYGIKELLDAFALIKDQDYRLWIRGNGEYEEEVKHRAKTDRRIIYMNRMSKKDLTQKQKEATIMINAVPSSQEFTKYFFPSKTLEYMASGTPTVMAHLACMPTEYDRYLCYFKDETPEGMATFIQEICNKPYDELNSFGEAAAHFIINNKSPKKQISKVINFIESLA